MEYHPNISQVELYRIEAEARMLRAEALRDAFAGLRRRVAALFSGRAARTA